MNTPAGSQKTLFITIFSSHPAVYRATKLQLYGAPFLAPGVDYRYNRRDHRWYPKLVQVSDEEAQWRIGDHSEKQTTLIGWRVLPA